LKSGIQVIGIGVDISQSALLVAEKNAEILGIPPEKVYRENIL
jgi:methylase of polypeptide subunit release factors